MPKRAVTVGIRENIEVKAVYADTQFASVGVEHARFTQMSNHNLVLLDTDVDGKLVFMRTHVSPVLDDMQSEISPNSLKLFNTKLVVTQSISVVRAVTTA